jgi:organic radical activating enzyme
MTEEEIVDTPEVIGALRVCITGGEPLMHNIIPLVIAMQAKGIRVHLETSGTISFRHLRRHCSLREWLWVCVSPKQDCLAEALEDADEIKILVNMDTDEMPLLEKFGKYINQNKVCISPVNGEHTLDQANMVRCFTLCIANPRLRLSIQLHKILGVR